MGILVPHLSCSPILLYFLPVVLLRDQWNPVESSFDRSGKSLSRAKSHNKPDGSEFIFIVQNFVLGVKRRKRTRIFLDKLSYLS